jgi:hypothetical protein
MRTLSSVKVIDNYKLQCTFENGETKVADIGTYMNAPAFKPLLQPDVFGKILNHQYFVEWKDCEVDLSADTLWHIGK